MKNETMLFDSRLWIKENIKPWLRLFFYIIFKKYIKVYLGHIYKDGYESYIFISKSIPGARFILMNLDMCDIATRTINGREELVYFYSINSKYLKRVPKKKLKLKDFVVENEVD